MALAEVVGRDGRVYAVDSDPGARDVVAEAAAAHSQVLAITQAGEDLILPEPVDLAFCRFLLLHVVDPLAVLVRMAAAVRPGGWVVAQEPITSAGRIGGAPLSMPEARHPDVGALLPALVRDGRPRRSSTPGPRRRPASGPGRWPTTWPRSPTSTRATSPVVLPPLVTVLAAGRRPAPGVGSPAMVRRRDRARPPRPRGGRRRPWTWPTRSWPGATRAVAGAGGIDANQVVAYDLAHAAAGRPPPPAPPSPTAPAATLEAAHGLRLRRRRAWPTSAPS